MAAAGEFRCYFSSIIEKQSEVKQRLDASQYNRDFQAEYSESREKGRTSEFNCTVKFEKEVRLLLSRLKV